jgi:hypothetical protein
MKRNTPGRVVEVNITVYILKQVDAIGREPTELREHQPHPKMRVAMLLLLQAIAPS